jgi:hypothetical protein
MGERQNGQPWLFEPEFNRAVKVQTTDQRITSDAGLLLLREADHRLGLCEHLAGKLHDPRRPDRIRYELKVKTTEHQIGKTRYHHCFGCRLLAISSRPEVWDSDWSFLADSR